MGQYQFGRRKQRPLKPKKSDDPYIFTIGNLLEWEHHAEHQLTKAGNNSATAKEETIKKLREKQQQVPVQISESVYISNASGVSDVDKLHKLGITHVLNVAGSMAAWSPQEEYEKKGIHYKMVDAIDEPTYDMLDLHLEECLEFMRGAQNNNSKNEARIVVHCYAGCNRSGVIVAAEHMLRTRTNVLETVLHCRTCRGNAFLTNNGFQGQLVALARREGLLGPAPGSRGCVVEPWLWRKVRKEIEH
ncbi:specificity protein phosphatase 26 [Seminavis robusta]|uniref:protein-serine/threonine phosphatase n=1 Tax=Seminavis robusta TaxID=568900 RepID=A0A9N8D6E7_9STRA|nr:specificity protein phosphatase 26 [Seminavis robusta]|eukprot:Sro17_g012630.1 specificity protein phosphatase 26 (246) ;mRNA; r:166880-167617